MRHFLGLDADNNLISTHTHKTYQTGLGGWAEDFDLDNPNSENPVVIGYKQRLKNKKIVRWKLLDCPCSPSKGVCGCASQARCSMRVDDNDALVPKPTCGFVIDGAPYDPNAALDRPPGTAMTLKIAGAEVPDNTTVTLAQGTQIQLMQTQEPSIELTFNGGETEEVTLYAPTHGLTGRVQAHGTHTCPMMFKVRGWQTA